MRETGGGLPRFYVRPLTADEGGGYLVEFPDYPGCMADGETPEEALAEARDALMSYTRTLAELGRDSPLVRGAPQSSERGSRSLQASLARRAADEGMPVSQLVAVLLRDALDKRETATGV